MKNLYPFQTRLIMQMLLIISGVFVNKSVTQAQCLSATYGLYPSSTFTPTCTGANQTITSCGYRGEYSNVNVVTGNTYTFSSSITTDFITIGNAAGTASYTTGTGSVTWTATVTGVVRFYTHTNSACGNATGCMTRRISCGTPPPAPANDNCANAVTLSCGSVVNGTSVNATTDASAILCGTSVSAPGVWYKVQGNGSSMTVSNCTGTTYDSKINVYSGSCGSFFCENGNDDACGLQSSVTWTTSAGTWYYILVQGYNNATGAFTISLTSTPAAPIITASGPLSFCDGGSVTLSSSASSGNTWSTGATSNSIVVNSAGTYTLTTGSGACVSAAASITVTVIPTPVLSISTTPETCPGALNGSVDLTISNASSPTIDWSIDGTGDYDDMEDMIGLEPQTLTLTVLNQGQCSATASATIGATPDNTAPTPDVATLPDLLGSCSVNATPPTATDNCAGPLMATTSDPLNYTTQGTYTITWTYHDGNGNTSTQTQTVIVDDNIAPTPDVATLSDVTAQCNATLVAPTASDNCAGTITATTTDPTSYSAQGTYTVTWTYNDGNGNTSTQTQTVTIDDTEAPVLSSPLVTITSECGLSVPAPTAIDNCAGNITASTADNTSFTTEGTYSINWNFDDGNGNAFSITQNVVVDDITAPVPNAATLPTVNAQCQATLTAPTATDNCSGTITATTSDAALITAQGTHTVTWTYNDGRGNTSTQTQTVIIDDNTAPTPSIANLPTLTDECSVTLSAPTATDNCAGFLFATSADPLTYSAEGTYTVTWVFNDGNGNTTTQTQTVIIQDVIAPVFSNCPSNMVIAANTASCSGIATWGTPIATDNCLLSALSSNFQSGDVFPLGTTTITYTAFDFAGNTTTCSFDVTVNNVLTSTIIETAVTCNNANDGSIDLTIGGGTAPFSVDWNNDGAHDGEDLNGISGGNYTANIIDANGCTLSATASVSEPDALQIQTDVLLHPTSCNTASGEIHISAIGGTLAYNYNWNNGNTTPDLNAVPAGVYTLTLSDGNNCNVTETYTLNDPNAPVVSVNQINPVLCQSMSNGSADITIQLSGSASACNVLWSNGSTTEDLNNVAQGTYTATVTDNNGCSSTISLSITEPLALTVNESVTEVSCKGADNGAIDLSVAGGTAPYVYTWDNGSNSEDIFNLPAGTYNVNITDANLCQINGSITVTGPNALLVQGTAQDEMFGNDGSVNLTVTGGTPPYAYSWNNGNNTEDLSNLSAGTYNVNVMDNNGCTQTFSITVGSQVGILSADASAMKLWPNPSSGNIQIEFTANIVGQLHITNVAGQLIQTLPVNGTRVQADLSTLEDGLYFCTIADESGKQYTISFTLTR
jgi:hypothetical protein